MKKNGLFVVLAVVLSLLSSCSFYLSPQLSPQTPKNVILLIGDGMGPQQLGLLFTYAKFAPHSIYNGEPTGIERMMTTGSTTLSLTSPDEKIVVDSACSATQLATGHISGSEMIGIDTKGSRVQTVLELAMEHGKGTGLVSDTRLTHATPAAFAAHQPHRSLTNEIASQMLESGTDVMLSGGLRHFIPQNSKENISVRDLLKELTGGSLSLKSKRKDNRNLLLEAQEGGYSLAFTKEQMAKVDEGKLLGLFSSSAMIDGIHNTLRKQGNFTSPEPSLKEMAMKAIEILSRKPKGFFLMVEGGQIDWAGHNNDTGAMLHEMLKFDEVVEAVYSWASKRDDTVVILTADHETGSFGFSYSRYDVPKGRQHPGEMFNNREYKPNFNFIDRSNLDRIHAQNMSYYDIMSTYNRSKEKGSEVLAHLISKATGFSVTSEEAATVLESEKNTYFLADHKNFQSETFPKVDDFEEFYVYGEGIRAALIGRVMSKYQGTVWGTGTHTATPVTVTVYGADVELPGISTHPEVGEMLKGLITTSLQ